MTVILEEIRKKIVVNVVLPTRLLSYLFIVIIAMHSSDTPILPYCRNGMRRHRRSPCVHVPWINRNTLNGNTTIQNRQSAIHKLKMMTIKQNSLCQQRNEHFHYFSQYNNKTYLIMNAAATFRTFGHFNNAITVNKLPQIPTIIIMMVTMAANVSRPRLNLESTKWMVRIEYNEIDWLEEKLQATLDICQVFDTTIKNMDS